LLLQSKQSLANIFWLNNIENAHPFVDKFSFLSLLLHL